MCFRADQTLESELTAFASTLDVVRTLVLSEEKGGAEDRDSVERVIQEELSRLQPLQDRIESGLEEQAVLLQKVLDTQKSFLDTLPEIRAEALERIAGPISRGLEAFTKEWRALSDANTFCADALEETFTPLRRAVDEWVADRKRKRIQLTNDLLVDELHSAVVSGDREGVRKLLQEREKQATPRQSDAGAQESVVIDIDERNREGLTATHLAVKHGHSEVFKLLVSHKADILARDSAGHSLLRTAIQEKQLGCLFSAVLPPLLPYPPSLLSLSFSDSIAILFFLDRHLNPGGMRR